MNKGVGASDVVFSSRVDTLEPANRLKEGKEKEEKGKRLFGGGRLLFRFNFRSKRWHSLSGPEHLIWIMNRITFAEIKSRV